MSLGSGIGKISPQKLLRETPETKARKEKVTKEIGPAQLAAFELWAFKAKTPMVYDERVPFLWQCVHSTKPMPEDLDACVNEMVRIWNSRFSEDGDVFVIEDV